jgi:hypothetical protein
LTINKKSTKTMLTKTDQNLPAALKVEFLGLMASWFLDEWRATEDDLTRDTDTPYTRGTTRFGRQKQRISLEYVSGKYDWLKVENNGLDIVFSINGVPCRFSNDNVDAPKKRAVLEVHQFQMSLLDESEPGEPARFVFVIDQGISEVSEPKVHLLGFSTSGLEVCRWTSGDNIRVMGEATASLPAPADLPKPPLSPKKQISEDDSDASNGS